MFKEGLIIYDKLCKVSTRVFDDGQVATISILNHIYKKGHQNILPQFCICFRILATIPISVATEERSFSKLKLIKNYLLSTTQQNRLNYLILLSIEHELAKTINYEEDIP